MRRGFAAVAVALACLTPGAVTAKARSQVPLPVFPAAVETVRVDAVVTDSNGRPVRGLRREDFVLREDGVAQVIVDFEAVGGPSPAGAVVPTPGTARTPPAPAANAPAAGILPASFLIVFDEAHLTPEDARSARAFVGRLLDTVQEEDRVTLVAEHDALWWSGVGRKGAEGLARRLETLAGRRPHGRGEDEMTPYEALRIVQGDRRVEQIVQARLRNGTRPPPPAGSRDAGSAGDAPEVGLRARVVYDAAIQHVRRLLEIVGKALETGAKRRGRTALVLVSGGFIDDPLLREYRELVRGFVRSGVTAYFYDARALSMGLDLGADVAARPAGGTGRLDPEYDRRRDDELRLQAEAAHGDASGSTRLADETGGFRIGVSDQGGLVRLETDARHYYLLGYVPTNATRDGKLRRISVEVRAPGAAVRARKAYYAPGKDDPPTPAAPTAARSKEPVPVAPASPATIRYLSLVQGYRAGAAAKAVDAVLAWPSGDLRRTVGALGGAPAPCPAECARAAAALHIDAFAAAGRAGRAAAAEAQLSLARAQIERLRGQSAESGFEALWVRATADLLLESDDGNGLSPAVELLSAFARRHPTDAPAQLALGRANEARQRVAGFVARTPRAEQPDLSFDELDFENIRYRQSRRGAPVAQGEEALRHAALLAYRQALALDPALVEARLRLGRELAQDGQADAARRELETVAGEGPAEARYLARLFLGRLDEDAGRLAEAARQYEQAVATRPLWQSGRLALADLLRRAGRRDEAALAVLAAVSSEDGPASEDGWLLYHLGAGYRANAALEALRRAVQR